MRITGRNISVAGAQLSADRFTSDSLENLANMGELFSSFTNSVAGRPAQTFAFFFRVMTARFILCFVAPTFRGAPIVFKLH